MNTQDDISGMRLIDTSKYTWKLSIGKTFWVQFYEGDQPNRFHRWMQKVFLGFKWEKIDESK